MAKRGSDRAVVERFVRSFVRSRADLNRRLGARDVVGCEPTAKHNSLLRLDSVLALVWGNMTIT